MPPHQHAFALQKLDGLFLLAGLVLRSGLFFLVHGAAQGEHEEEAKNAGKYRTPPHGSSPFCGFATSTLRRLGWSGIIDAIIAIQPRACSRERCQDCSVENLQLRSKEQYIVGYDNQP
jgi:hypothetical protein